MVRFVERCRRDGGFLDSDFRFDKRQEDVKFFGLGGGAVGVDG